MLEIVSLGKGGAEAHWQYHVETLNEFKCGGFQKLSQVTNRLISICDNLNRKKQKPCIFGSFQMRPLL